MSDTTFSFEIYLETGESVQLTKECPHCRNDDKLKKKCFFCDKIGFIITDNGKTIMDFMRFAKDMVY